MCSGQIETRIKSQTNYRAGFRGEKLGEIMGKRLSLCLFNGKTKTDWAKGGNGPLGTKANPYPVTCRSEFIPANVANITAESAFLFFGHNL